MWGSAGEIKISTFTASRFLDHNNSLDTFQPGARMHHSTASALLRMTNLSVCLDSGNHAILILLEPPAGFDTVDHSDHPDCLKAYGQQSGPDGCSGFPPNYKTHQFQLGSITFRLLLHRQWCTTGSCLGPVFFNCIRFWTAQHPVLLLHQLKHLYTYLYSFLLALRIANG